MFIYLFIFNILDFLIRRTGFGLDIDSFLLRIDVDWWEIQEGYCMPLV